MEPSTPRQPSPKFYKAIALVFLAVGFWLLRQAIVGGEWLYWAFAILTLFNALMAGLKSMVPPKEAGR